MLVYRMVEIGRLVTSIVGVIREGHWPEEKSRLVQAPWKMFQEKTGVSDRRAAELVRV